MKRHCSLRLDLLPGESDLSWQVFDRLSGANGGIIRTISASTTISPEKIIESFTTSVIKTCNGAHQQTIQAALRAWGSTACKEILPDEIRRKLTAFDGGDVLFMVPLEWADFPFEILHIPTGFLGQRFQIGTIINSGVPQGPEKHFNQAGDLMIITDFSENLQSVCSEGASLKSAAVNRKRQVRLVMQADNQKLAAEIPLASMVHFAGHSGPDQEFATAGWRLGQGNYFDTNAILGTGTSPVLPWLVFSNSCDGGRIMVNPGLSGIAGAFLSAGVQQVVGPFCKLNDVQAKRCTIGFYYWIFRGKSAAQALMLLRRKSPEGTGLTPLFYRLFGDPRFTEPAKKTPWRRVIPVIAGMLIVLSLLMIGIVIGIRVGGGVVSFNINLYAPTVNVLGSTHRNIDKQPKAGPDDNRLPQIPVPPADSMKSH